MLNTTHLDSFRQGMFLNLRAKDLSVCDAGSSANYLLRAKNNHCTASSDFLGGKVV